jgi:uncharacterized Tic20 family protein
MTKSSKFPLYALESVFVMEFQATDAYSNFYLTIAIYSIIIIIIITIIMMIKTMMMSAYSYISKIHIPEESELAHNMIIATIFSLELFTL